MESLQIRAIKVQYIVFIIITNTISSISIQVNLNLSSIFKALDSIFVFLLPPFLSSTYYINLIQPIVGMITAFWHLIIENSFLLFRNQHWNSLFFLNLHNSGNPRKEGNVINFNVLQPKLGHFRDPYQNITEQKYLFILAWLDLSRSKTLQGFTYANACSFLLAFP